MLCNYTQFCTAINNMLGSIPRYGVESHIRSMGFKCGVYKALDSPTTTASLRSVVLPRFISNHIINHEKKNAYGLSESDSPNVSLWPKTNITITCVHEMKLYFEKLLIRHGEYHSIRISQT